MIPRPRSFAQLKPNPDWAKLPLFDRKGWKTVRFGEVVRMLKEQVDPAAEGVARYVAGEHMQTENVHICKWGSVGNGYLGPAFIRRFRKGQVLYGSRRTYLKKVAVAEWDGVTANTTFVLEAVEGELLQELLPWLMLSERFTKHSIQESKGSTNPYINFPDIAKFEFALPPLDQQRRIAEILWAVDEPATKTEGTVQSGQALAEAELHEFLYGHHKWPLVKCAELLPDGPKNGYSPPSTVEPNGLPTLSISAVRDGKVIPEGSLKYADVKEDEIERFKLYPRDILVVRGNGNRTLCGRAGLVDKTPPGCFYPDLLIRLRFRDDALLPEFAVLQWNDRKTHTRLLSRAKSTNGIWKINGKDIQSHTIVLPPIAEQKRFLDHASQSSDLITKLRASHRSLLALQTALLTSLFT
jgi:type I restriction enzyme S subunit